MFLAIAALALTTVPMPRIDTGGSSIDWLRGTVQGEETLGACVVTGKYTHECMYRPSPRSVEYGAFHAVLRRIMTLVVVDECTGWDAIQIEPSLRKLAQDKTRTSSRQIDAETWHGNATLVLDIELVRAFEEACERAPSPVEPAMPASVTPKAFTAADERVLYKQVDDALRAWGK